MKQYLVVLALVAAVFSGESFSAQAPKPSTPPSPAAMALLQQGTEALRAGNSDQAITLFEEVTRDSPRFAEGYLNLGLALSQRSRNQEAATAIQKGLALKPAMRGANLFLAIADYRLGRYEAASAAIVKETKAFPSDAQAWMWQGIINLARGQLTLAVESLDHASSLDPKNVDILYHRGRAALALSRQSYEAMFKLDPQSWHVHQVLAEADVESGNDADAIEQFKLAIASAPQQGGGLYEALGSSYWRAGKYDEAQQAYETALKLDPNDTITLYKLGCLRIDRADATGGKPLLERVLVADPSLVMTTYYLGRAEFQLGNDQAAIADFTKTIQNNLDDDTTKQAYFQLSRAYRRVHDLPASDQAQAQYRLLDQKSKDAMQEKLSQRQRRADRDISIPAPSQSPPSAP